MNGQIADDAINNELLDMIGQRVTGYVIDENRLAIALSSGHSVSSIAWQILFDGGCVLDATGYAQARVEQLTEAERLQNSPSDTGEDDLNNLYEKTLAAGERDEETMEQAKNVISSWPDKLTVKLVTRNSINSIQISFSEVPASIAFYGYGDLMLCLSVKTANQEYQLMPNGIEVV